METALLVFLIVIANLTLYWVFFGKKKFEQQMYPQHLHPKEKEQQNGEK